MGTQFLVNDLGIERMAERVGSFLGLEQHENRRHQGVTLTHATSLNNKVRFFVLPFADYIVLYVMHSSFVEANILKDYTCVSCNFLDLCGHK